MTHAITIDPIDQPSDVVDAIGRTRTRWYRWRCSCDATGPDSANARCARTGGARHVAAMERAR